MKKILYNEDNLKEEEVNRIVRRGKIIIINSNDKILLAHSDNNYFLIGGRCELNETFEDCIRREVKEETGIDIKFDKLDLILTITYMNKDYPESGINSKTINNYYYIKCDDKPNLKEINLTEEEIETNFELCYVHKDNIIKLLTDNLKTCIKQGVARDTIEAINEFFNL